MSDRRALPFVVLLAAVAAANAFAWSWLVPGGGAAPDEQAHDAVALHVREHGNMPVLGEPGFEVQVVPLQWRGRTIGFPYQPYATHPPGAYALAAASIAARGTIEGPSGYRWSRLPQSLLVGLLVAVAFVAARAMFPTQPLLWGSGATLVALWPQVAYLGAYLNPDLAATVASGAVFWALFRGARAGWRLRDVLLLGVLLGLVVLTKPTAWVVAVPALLVAALTLRGSARHVLTRLAIVVGAVLAIAGPWALQQVQRYDGDLTGVLVQREAVHESGATPIGGPENGVSYLELLTDHHWVGTTTRTFVLAIPTHRTTPLEAAALVLLVALGGIGIVSGLVRRGLRPVSRADRVHVAAALAIPLTAGVASYNAWEGDLVFQGQGRYLFPVLLPILLYGLWGCSELAGRRGAGLVRTALALVLAVACTSLLLSTRSLERAYDHGPQVASTAALLLPIILLALGMGWTFLSSRPARPGTPER